jgi:hypothetical protein
LIDALTRVVVCLVSLDAARSRDDIGIHTATPHTLDIHAMGFRSVA